MAESTMTVNVASMRPRHEASENSEFSSTGGTLGALQ
jgi:hypothetical protein